MGAVDYITKPISPPIVLARVATHLKIKAAADFLRDKNAFLGSGGRSAHARGERDPERHDHRHGLARRDARQRHRQPHPPHPVLRQSTRRAAERPSSLQQVPDRSHDQHAVQVGSAARHRQGRDPRPHLLKPGRFTPEEFEIMKTHTTLGRDAIQARRGPARHGGRVPALRQGDRLLPPGEMGRQRIPPRARQARTFPTSARLMAVADVYDALISRRIYKDGMPHVKAAQIMGRRPWHPLRPGYRRCLRRAAG